MKFPVLKKIIDQSGWVVGGWRVHRVGGGVGGGVVGSWRVHRVGAYDHPPMNSYNVKIFNFMSTHPPTHQLNISKVSLYIYFGGFMGWVVVGWLECSLGGCVVGGFMGWLVGGFIGWVGVWWCGWC